MTEFEKRLHSMFDHIWECEIDHPVFQDTVGELMSAVIQCYNNLPSAQPKSCEDAVSREKVFEYFVSLWECIGTIMDRDEWEDVCKATANELPSVQPSFPQAHENDCISRQDAIDEIGRFIGYIDEDMIERIRIGLKRLPSAQPEHNPDDERKIADLHEKVNYLYDRLKEQFIYVDYLISRVKQRWIPVTERLPAYGEDVLISIGGYCNVGHIVSVNEEEQYNWYFSGWYHLPNDVDAWMPLPEPYREEGETDG